MSVVDFSLTKAKTLTYNREGWNQIMSDYEVAVPMCVRGENFYESDCGSQGYARALFVSWNILSMYIFVSMVCLSIALEPHDYKIDTISLSPLSSKVLATSTSVQEARLQCPGQKLESLKRRGKSSIRRARGIFPKRNFQDYWG